MHSALHTYTSSPASFWVGPSIRFAHRQPIDTTKNVAFKGNLVSAFFSGPVDAKTIKWKSLFRGKQKWTESFRIKHTSNWFEWVEARLKEKKTLSIWYENIFANAGVNQYSSNYMWIGLRCWNKETACARLHKWCKSNKAKHIYCIYFWGMKKRSFNLTNVVDHLYGREKINTICS